MEDKIRNIMHAVFGIETKSIDQNSTSESIENWDSLHHMNLIFALEEEFSLVFDEEEIIEMTSFSKVCNIVAEKV